LNKIKEIKPTLGNIISLKELHLSNNRLESIPAEIGQLKNLETLSLRDNKIKSIPKEIGKLFNLKNLLLQGNELATLPRELANTNLNEEERFLKLASNPLVGSIIKALKAGGIDALFDYMLDETYTATTSGELDDRKTKDDKLKAASKVQMGMGKKGKEKDAPKVESVIDSEEAESSANLNYQIIEDAARPSKLDSPTSPYSPIRASLFGEDDGEEYDPTADYCMSVFFMN
jgi:Leucine-rich repeat (LRR) protein